MKPFNCIIYNLKIVVGYTLFLWLMVGCGKSTLSDGENSKLSSCYVVENENYTKMLAACEITCTKGDPISCNNIAYYWRGDNKNSNNTSLLNKEKARKYFEKACQIGDKKSPARLSGCFELAGMWRSGEGGEASTDKARRIYENLCSLDYGAGCFALGIQLYEEDNNLEEGRLLFKKACKLKDLLSCPGSGRGIIWKDKKRWNNIQILQGIKENEKPNTVPKMNTGSKDASP